MNIKMKTTKTFAAVIAALALAPAVAAAAPSAPPASRTWSWPLQQIDRAAWAASGTVTATVPRPNMWSSHVEFQKFPQQDMNDAETIDAHPGIDIRSQDGDLVLFPTGGTIVHVSRSDECGGNRMHEGGIRCRLWVVTPTTGGAKSYLYYIGHLDTGHRPDGTMTSLLRDQLAFANADGATMDADVSPPVTVAAAATAGQVVQWPAVIDGDANSHWDHLHVGIFDPDDQYSSLDPLAFLGRDFTSGGKPQVILDYARPVIKNVQLRAHTSGSGTVGSGGTCGPVLTGTLDIVADIKDKFTTSAPPPASFAGDYLPPTTGIKGARWLVRRLADGASTGAQWFESPLGCTGVACGVWRFRQQDRATFTSQTAFFNFLTTNSESGAPVRAGTQFASRLWDQGLSNNDHVSASEVDIIHILTQGTREDETHLAEGWNTAGAGDGRYVVSVEAWDFDGNLTQSSSLVTVGNGGNPTVPAFVQLRDHDQDFGQIPSTIGDQAFWLSPDLWIADKLTTPSGPRSAPVVVGQDYDVYVRVSNRGCQAPAGVQVAVYSALAGTAFSDFKEITTPAGGYVTGTVTDLGDGTLRVGPFNWSPTLADLDGNTQGHRCLLAAVTATGDGGPAVVPANWNVTSDPKVAQRNVQFDLLQAYIRNVSGTQKTSRLVVDMGGLPVESGSSFELVFNAPAAAWPTLESAWKPVAGIDVSRTGDQLHVKFNQQKVTLPDFPMPAVSQIFVQAVGTSPQNSVTYSIRLDHYLDNALVGGMIFQLYQAQVR